MSLFEWLGESSNPGPVGEVKVGGESIPTIWLPFTIARFALTFGLLVASMLAGTFYGETPQLLHGMLAGGAFLLYLFAGYFIRPRPDTSNIGYLGGLIDDPFRYSDDYNRMLMLFTVLLLPGYVLARPCAELFAWVAGETDII